MSTPAATTYDDIPYSNHAFSQTHPDNLAVVARMMGLECAPVENCRVLELGSGRGGNLIPLAESLPGSRFLGVDLSARQIEEAQAAVRELQLTNVTFQQADIGQLGPELGEFDYIICHGVYSWVPTAVQESIFRICATRLAPRGVAFVSYNTYPGWHIRGVVRDMLYYHCRQHTVPVKQIASARGFIQFLKEKLPGGTSPYGHLLRDELTRLENAEDTYLFHEHLETFNRPEYFYQFMGRAAGHGLQYVGEVQASTKLASVVEESHDKVVDLSVDRLEQEQYSDFLMVRVFRQTLLCRGDVPLQSDPQCIRQLLLSARARPESATPDVTSQAVESFCTSDGVKFSTTRPLLKAALCELTAAYPRALEFEELYRKVEHRLSGQAEAACDPEQLVQALWKCSQAQAVHLHVYQPRYASAAGEYPRTTASARLQAVQGDGITNLRHRTVEVSAFERMLLPYLDGTRNRARIVADLCEAAARGDFEISHEGQATQAPEVVREFLEAAVDESCVRLAHHLLLVADS